MLKFLNDSFIQTAILGGFEKKIKSFLWFNKIVLLWQFNCIFFPVHFLFSQLNLNVVDQINLKPIIQITSTVSIKRPIKLYTYLFYATVTKVRAYLSSNGSAWIRDIKAFALKNGCGGNSGCVRTLIAFNGIVPTD